MHQIIFFRVFHSAFPSSLWLKSESREYRSPYLAEFVLRLVECLKEVLQVENQVLMLDIGKILMNSDFISTRVKDGFFRGVVIKNRIGSGYFLQILTSCGNRGREHGEDILRWGRFTLLPFAQGAQRNPIFFGKGTLSQSG